MSFELHMNGHFLCLQDILHKISSCNALKGGGRHYFSAGDPIYIMRLYVPAFFGSHCD